MKLPRLSQHVSRLRPTLRIGIGLRFSKVNFPLFSDLVLCFESSILFFGALIKILHSLFTHLLDNSIIICCISELTWAMASKQCPPETRRTRNGNSTWSTIRAVSACASMWWIGIRGLFNFRLRYWAYWDPILRRDENYINMESVTKNIIQEHVALGRITPIR